MRGMSFTWSSEKLDGNRQAAREAFLKRGDTSEVLFDDQMAKIESTDVGSFRPIVFDTFERNTARFLSKDHIVNELFKLAGFDVSTSLP